VVDFGVIEIETIMKRRTWVSKQPDGLLTWALFLSGLMPTAEQHFTFRIYEPRVRKRQSLNSKVRK
jgi:hypothetical protein